MTDLPCDTEPADKASCYGTAQVFHPASRAENGCDDCPYARACEAYTSEAAPQPPVQAAELLGRAARHMHDRASTYDAPGGERSMGKAVTAFNAITGHTLSESEGWLLLQALKDVRLFTRSAYHADSAEDCIAYAALKAEARGDGR